MPTVLVLDGEAKAAPAVVRTLARGGHRVIVAAAEADAPAARSRYASLHLSHPHPARASSDFANWVDRAVTEQRPDCVLPLTECSIRALHRERGRFSGRTALALPPEDSIDVAFDKERVLSLAQSLGVDVPQTWRPEDAFAAAELARAIQYPNYVKARQSYRDDGAPAEFARGRFAHRPSDCIEAWRRLHAAVPLPLIQEAIPGPVVCVGGVWDQGRALCRFCYVVHTSWPISGGQSVWRESIPAQDAPIEQTGKLLAALRWTGPAHVQFVRDARDARFRLMEINPRFWGSLDAAHHAGVPVALRTFQLAIGQQCPADLHYRVGVRSRSIEGDLKRSYAVAFHRRNWVGQSLEMPRLSQCLWDLLRGLAPGIHGDDFYLDDPKVGAAILIRAMRRAFRKDSVGASQLCPEMSALPALTPVK